MAEQSLVIKAAQFAQKAHINHLRLSGVPYFEHVQATAKIIARWGLDEATTAAAFLHDVIEDTPATLEQLRKEFGDEIAFLVDGVTKLGRVKYRGSVVEMENMRKFILAVSQDVRVILIKLADRLHNMRTLQPLPPAKQKRIAAETLEIYAPLAYRLGMFELSGELEDLSFAYLQPDEFKWLKTNVKKHYQERKEYVKRFTPLIKEELIKNQVNLITINSRAKRYYSLYKKLQRYDMELDRIYDLIAVRCIVKTITDCYTALGIIHGRWLPLPSRIKDYVAMPKPNGYQSLHTTIFGPEQQLIEIQIRTMEMHHEAEFGIAAHWAYYQAKTFGKKNYRERKAIFADQRELSWVKRLRTWQENLRRPREFMDALKTDLLADQILTLTPKGQAIELPKNSTPIDFAYKIHSDIGDSCVGVKINGAIAALDTKLKIGDVVEVLTQKNKKPSEAWLNFIKTSHARNRIKAALRRKHQRLIPAPSRTIFRLVAENKSSILNETINIVSQSRVNLISHSKQIGNFGDKFHLIKINCLLDSRQKAELLANRFKKIEGIRKVEYRFG